MEIKAKLCIMGNSQGIYISKDVITSLGLEVGNVITLQINKPNVITYKKKKARNVITSGKQEVITSEEKPKVYTPVITPTEPVFTDIEITDEVWEEDGKEIMVRG